MLLCYVPLMIIANVCLNNVCTISNFLEYIANLQNVGTILTLCLYCVVVVIGIMF
uniref:Uncharacterized protein n=1 Tax=Physcomitrium patens TaxID=3218 RepID=A0A2K1K6U0_PHYPA|nr:hypothetical protein PHYPA_011399 [Physcomitrium patens]